MPLVELKITLNISTHMPGNLPKARVMLAHSWGLRGSFTECLRKHYESVYTQPAEEFIINNPDTFFNISGSVGSSDLNSHCDKCRAELVHECEEDRRICLFVEEESEIAAPERLFVDGDSEEAYRRRNPTK